VQDEDWKDIGEYGVNKVDFTAPFESLDGMCLDSIGSDDEKDVSKEESEEEEDSGGEQGERRRAKRAKKSKQAKRTVEEQLIDMYWEFDQEDKGSKSFTAVGDQVLVKDNTKHPLWAYNCNCPHCRDLRKGKESLSCRCEHCYVMGYFEAKAEL